jgi:hypothetical protein
MKRNIFNILLLASAAVALSSCKDDDKKASSLKIDGESTAITAGLLFYSTDLSGENNDFYRHEIVLLGKGLSSDNTGDVTGEGNGLSLEIASATTSLEVGTYTFTGTDVDNEPFDFWNGSAYTGVNTQQQQELDFTEGTITVSKSGDTYTINVTGAAGDAAIEAYYSGKLIMVED